jgi:hypothetical protein
VIGSTPDRLALRIAAWLALAILIAIAFYYAKKYEAEMLTDAAPGCGIRLSRPTLGPSLCQGCNAPKPFENLEAYSLKKRRRPVRKYRRRHGRRQ